MIVCKLCQTENSVDSRFCKACGGALPEEVIEEARQRLESLVSEGFRAFNDGRSDVARLIADSALAEDPGLASAISLKGMCHERAGELAEALDCFERVVAMNPDSSLDRIKVTHLRKMLANRLQEPPRGDRKMALIGALAAVVLVVSLGVALAGFVSGSPKAKDASLEGGRRFTTAMNFDDRTGNPSSPNQAQEREPASQQAPVTSSGRESPGEERASVQPITPNARIGALPRPEEGNEPLRIPIPEGVRIEPSVAQAGPPTQPVKPAERVTGRSPDEGPDPEIAGAPTSPAPRNAGIINIRVASKPPALTGSVDASDPLQIEALVRAAQQDFLLGRFDSAAKKYESALAAGADAGRTNQRLAQCYERLNRKSEAIVAYEKAIAAYEAALASGTPNASPIQSALDACRQALKVLRGQE